MKCSSFWRPIDVNMDPSTSASEKLNSLLFYNGTELSPLFYVIKLSE